MGEHRQNPNSPLRSPERLAAEFGLPYKKKKRRWNVTEKGFERVSGAGKGDHRRGQDPESEAKYQAGYDQIDWSDDGKEDRCSQDTRTASADG